MKKTEQVIGLPVIDISSGSQLGMVTGVVVSPEQGGIECLLLSSLNWYEEMRALPFGDVLGIGEFAVTILNGDGVYRISSSPELITLLERGIQVIKAGVMTKSGKYIGTVTEYAIDELSGKIIGCHVTTEDGKEIVVPGEKAITFGAKYIVIEDEHEKYLVNDISEVLPAAAAPKKPAPPVVKVAEVKKPQNAPTVDPVEIFESRQRQYLAGKKATKKITGTGGQVIVEQGAVITEEIIEKALAMDKYIELTMNVSEL